MGRFKRQDVSVNGHSPLPSPQRASKEKVEEVDEDGSRWIGGGCVKPFLKATMELPPETPQERLERKRAIAFIMARRFGIKDWHREVLTEEEIAGIEEERGGAVT